MNKKAGIPTLFLIVMFVIVAVGVLIVVTKGGYQPDVPIGHNEIGLLTLKEEAVSDMIVIDQALRYSSYKAIIDVADNSVLTDTSCGFHLNPLITDKCTYDDEVFFEYLDNNFDFYTREFEEFPSYSFKIETDEKTKITAIPNRKMRVYESESVFNPGANTIFDTWPSDSKVLNSCYGNRKLIIDGKPKEDYTDGIDIDSDPKNQAKVLAVAEGVIHSVCVNPCNLINDKDCERTCNGFGTNIVVAHNIGFLTRYSHLDAEKIEFDEDDEGKPVRKGILLGYAGNTGFSLGDHLDFKIYANVADLSKKDGALSPFCFFNQETIEGITFGPEADSCKIKYPEGIINLTNPPVALATECQKTDTSSVNTQKLEEANQGIIAKARQFDKITSSSAQLYKIPESFLKAIITQESAFNPLARSRTGAAGIAQFTAATGESAGLHTIACCTKDEALKGICHTITNRCTVNNDDRFVPEKAIPASAKLLGNLFTKYENSIALVAIAYNAGEGVADAAKAKCGIVTIENYETCAEDSIIDYYTKEYNEEFAEKKVDEVFAYVKKINDYYNWWGGVVGQVALYGNYYEVNPVSEAEINFNLREFEEVQLYANSLMSACNDKLDVEVCEAEVLADYVDEQGERTVARMESPMCNGQLVEVEKKRDDTEEDYEKTLEINEENYKKIANFIKAYEECKNADWEELNITDSCSCDLSYPKDIFVVTKVIDGISWREPSASTWEKRPVSLKITPYSLQFIIPEGLTGEKLIYEHPTSPDPPKYYDGNINFGSYSFNSARGVIDESGDIIKGPTGSWELSRDSLGIILKDSEETCEYRKTLYSYCFDTGKSIPWTIQKPDGEYVYENVPIILPFSVKIK